MVQPFYWQLYVEFKNNKLDISLVETRILFKITDSSQLAIGLKNLNQYLFQFSINY